MGTNTYQFKVTGMSCASCAHHIEQTLLKDSSVLSASVHFPTEKASVSSSETPEEIQKIFTTLGYKTKMITESTQPEPKEIKQFWDKRMQLLLISSILTFPFLLHMLSMLQVIHHIAILDNPWIQWLLATPVQFYVGKDFYIKAFQNLRNKTAGMDVLVSLGTSAAYFYSVINMFLHRNEVYFETSTMIITLVLLGKTLEYRARQHTSNIMSKILSLQAKDAIVLKGGNEVLVPYDQLQIGHILLVRPGEKIPVDGNVIKGFSSIDESLLTGESISKDVTVGDLVFGGTINKEGALHIKAQKVGRETLLASIIQMVEKAQSTKAPIQRIADIIAGYFAIAVIGIAFVTGIFWFFYSGNFTTALMNSISILVIACPCALGLATPISLMVGMGKGAEQGILFKSGESLEKMHKITTVALDKTGTITTAQQNVTDILAIEPWTKEEVLHLAAIAEKNSEHPLGVAIVNKAKEEGLEIEDPEQFKSYPGEGITATYKHQNIRLGKIAFIDPDPQATLSIFPEIDRLQQEGHSVLYLSINQKHAAIFIIADTIKTNSKTAIQLLKKEKIHVVMMTGDHYNTALAIGKQVGIEDILAGVLPEEKANEVKNRQDQGEVVAMVGDGVNDAPALVTADVGIVMGSGADIALEAGEITLLKGDLQTILRTIQLSKKTMRNIKQNLFWAFFYNAIGIPIAAMGLLAPWVAGTAMAFSSLSVVLNAARLKRS